MTTQNKIIAAIILILIFIVGYQWGKYVMKQILIGDIPQNTMLYSKHKDGTYHQVSPVSNWKK